MALYNNLIYCKEQIERCVKDTHYVLQLPHPPVTHEYFYDLKKVITLLCSYLTFYVYTNDMRAHYHEIYCKL